MKLTSPAFKDRGRIPDEYTCANGNVSPEFHFEGIPSEAKSLAIIVDDPDAPMGTFIHWLAWNIDPSIRTIGEGTASAVGMQGTTSFGRTGYGGPCPPPGKVHRYFFKLYALDAMLDLPQGASILQLEAQIKEHIVGTVELVGIYGR